MQYLYPVIVALGLLSAADAQQAPVIDRKAQFDRVYSSGNAIFSAKPNAFLAEVIRGRVPGKALDLGMGQGRNALFLAQQGWDVTGVDVSEEGVAQARAEARKLGVKVNAVVQSAQDFDFGTDRWDLIVVMYFGPRAYVSSIRRGLKVGGIVVLEGFHRESFNPVPNEPDRPIFADNELLKIFDGFRILRYEDVVAASDWRPEGVREQTRVVRLLAGKTR